MEKNEDRYIIYLEKYDIEIKKMRKDREGLREEEIEYNIGDHIKIKIWIFLSEMFIENKMKYEILNE